MEHNIYDDVAKRTNGDVYLGVVGPVRTGKSTFIKKFMELLVLPNIDDDYELEQARDELPQSGNGKTIMTTEPKFIPAEAVELVLNETINMKVRMVDCVGYAVDGANGYEDEEGVRMVLTPWSEEPMPFGEAAEIGTRKVIAEHSTIGIVITTDGSVTDLPREAYVEAEERVVTELQEIGKPFVIILNTANPQTEEALLLTEELEEKYGVAAVALNCAKMTEEDIVMIMETVLYEFAVSGVEIKLPMWVAELPEDHWLYEKLNSLAEEVSAKIERLKDIDLAIDILGEEELLENISLMDLDLGTGFAVLQMTEKPELYDQILEEINGCAIEGKHTIIRLMSELNYIKKEYDKVAEGIREVKNTGYGLVAPRVDEMSFAVPELIKKGNQFCVKLKAHAPSIHLIKADIETEVTPLIGSEKQCEELVHYIQQEFEDNPEKIWESNIFGKSVYELVTEGIQRKLFRMPENAQEKLQETLEKIVNESSGGLICIII